MNTCKLPDCSNPTRGYGWCTAHRQAWKRGQLTQTMRVEVIPSPVPVEKPKPVMPTPGHRCGSCTRVFPVLVDGILCIDCDSLFYPARPIRAAS